MPGDNEAVPAELAGDALEDAEHAHFEGTRAGATHVRLVLLRRQRAGFMATEIPVARFVVLREWLRAHWADGRVSHGPVALNWPAILASDAIQDERFYEDTDEFGAPKPAGWAWLMDGEGDEDGIEVNGNIIV